MKIKNLIIFSILILYIVLSCKKESIYIEVDGKKITESDLEKEMPEQFKMIRQEYNARVIDLLRELAHRRMFEKEAKEKNLSVNEYLQKIQDETSDPTKEEVENYYKKLEETGQTKNHKEEDLKNRIFQYLKQQSIQSAFIEEISRLKKKYNYFEPVERIKVNIDNEPVRGNPDAKITIVEFSDFECPYCLKFQETGKQIRAKYGDKIKWVFKDFPLDFHQNAMPAHITARCIYKYKPDKFWEFFDFMFSPNRDKSIFSRENLKSKSLKLGLTSEQFENCLQDASIMEKIRNNISHGQEIGVTGTPAFFINGRKITGAQPLSVFEEIIDEELTN